MRPIILSVAGYNLTEQERTLFTEGKPLGFILFSRNISSKEQLSILIKDLKSLSIGHNPLIFIDQEGGRVQRIKPPVGEILYPNTASFSEIYEKDADAGLHAVTENFTKLATELRSFDIDSPCAPCVDLRVEGAHDIIGDRSFSTDVEVVVALSEASINAIIKAGCIPVIKHMPGHGRATEDSHTHLPHVDTDLATLEATDFAVFKKLSSSAAKVAMTAHIVYSCLDAKPATLSTTVIKYIRENIGFQGLIMSDDICMKALYTEGADFGALTKQILAAGCDIVLYCEGKIEQMRQVIANTSELSDKDMLYFNKCLEHKLLVSTDESSAHIVEAAGAGSELYS